MQKTLEYVLIEPNELLRDGLCSALSREFGAPAASVGSLPELQGSDVLASAELLVADLGDDVETVSLAIREIRSTYATLKLLILADSYQPARVVAAVQAGADGYQVKTAARDVITRSVEYLLLGGLVLPTEARKLLVRDISGFEVSHEVPPAFPGNRRQHLSNQEIRILKRLVEGASNKEIAREFELSGSTVKAHVKNIFRKLNVSNRTKAAMWARDNLLDGPEPGG